MKMGWGIVDNFSPTASEEFIVMPILAFAAYHLK